ncbi:MAG: hypothetical protein ACJ8R9_17245 [Steroidobacteraceae bacterium]
MGINKEDAVSGGWARPSNRKDRDALVGLVAMHNDTSEETATAGLTAYVRIGGTAAAALEDRDGV